MDDFDRELEELSDAISKDEELHAAHRIFEQSQLWQEHKRYHDEQHTQARLVIWEDVAPVQAQQFQEEGPAPERKHIKVGGCECQPKFAFMLLEDNGAVTAGIPGPVEEAKAYSAESAQTYGTAPDVVQNVYNAAPGGQKDLYR